VNHGVKMIVVARKMQHGAAENAVGKVVWKGHSLYRLQTEVTVRERRMKLCGERPDVLDGLRVGVRAKNLETLLQQIHEVPARATPCIENPHAGRNASAKDLIKDINVDETELFLQTGHNEILPRPFPTQYHVRVDQDLRKAVEAIYAAVAHHDYPALRQLLDPQIEWHSSENFLYGEHNPYVGIEMFLEFQRQIQTDWETFSIRPDEVLVAADTLIVRGRYQGKFRGTGFGLDAEFVHVLRFRDGKLMNGQSYTDTAQFRDAVKHLQRPGPPDRAVETATISAHSIKT
jgi:ketosteroid isomerase-like protein